MNDWERTASRAGFPLSLVPLQKSKFEMQNVTQLMQCDAEQMFRDWGEPARFLELMQRYDVESGQLVEVTFATELRVIRMEDKAMSMANVSATLDLTKRLVLVKAADLPDDAPLSQARLTFEEWEYVVEHVRESNVSGMLVLECVQRGPLREN